MIVQESPPTAGFAAPPEGVQQELWCFAYRGRAGAQAAEREHPGLVPHSPQADCHQQRSVEQSDCACFYVCCKWWLLHPKMHKWQLLIPRVRCHPEQVGVNASLETLSAFRHSTGTFFMPLFPQADNTCSTTACFSPRSQSVPLTEVSLCLIKKCLPCVLGSVHLSRKWTSGI